MKRRAWTITLIVFLAGVALAVAQNKVPPCILTLMEYFEINMATAGLLSSIFSIMAMATAIPAALILTKLGPKKCGMIALGCAIAGSFIGVFSSTLTSLFISRIIEGFGVGVIAVVGPALISMWFPPEKRGLPMGVWGSWQMVAQAGTFFVGNFLTIRYGWQGLWWFGIVVLIIALILYTLKVTSPPNEVNFADVQAEGILLREGFKSRSAWFMGGAALCFCFSCFGFCTWIAPYWSQAFGWDIDIANKYVSIIYTLEIGMVIAVGWFLDRVTDRKMVGKIAFVLYAIILFVSFRISSPKLIIPFIILYPLLEGAIPTAFWTMIAQTTEKPELAGIAIGILGLLQNLGMVLGPPITGAVIENYGWATGTIPITISALIGLVLFSMVTVYPGKEC